jgi:hypothetical protein
MAEEVMAAYTESQADPVDNDTDDSLQLTSDMFYERLDSALNIPFSDLLVEARQSQSIYDQEVSIAQQALNAEMATMKTLQDFTQKFRIDLMSPKFLHGGFMNYAETENQSRFARDGKNYQAVTLSRDNFLDYLRTMGHNAEVAEIPGYILGHLIDSLGSMHPEVYELAAERVENNPWDNIKELDNELTAMFDGWLTTQQGYVLNASGKLSSKLGEQNHARRYVNRLSREVLETYMAIVNLVTTRQPYVLLDWRYVMSYLDADLRNVILAINLEREALEAEVFADSDKQAEFMRLTGRLQVIVEKL